MMIHRYTFEKYQGPGTKHTCPQCNKTRVFTRYIDLETGLIIHPSVGRCDRESNCGYHYPPKEYFKDNDITPETNRSSQIKRKVQLHKPTSYHTTDLMESTLKGYKCNNFVNYLIGHFGYEETGLAVQKYFVGTSKYWTGSTVFWQVDIKGKIRTGKILLYNMETGKRVKEPFSHITWVHTVLKQSEFELKQCLFGEHLLKNTSKPIALVESEKTAIIASICLPKYVWLATGGLSNLTAKKCNILKGHSVVLFPDLNGYDKWDLRAKELSRLMPGTHFEISNLLEKIASEEERAEGSDIADFLIKFRKSIAENDTALHLLIEKNPELSKLAVSFDLVDDEPKS